MRKEYSEAKSEYCSFGALRRGAGVVELARLESVYRRNPIKGSNPFPSAYARRSFSEGVFAILELSSPLRALDHK